MLKNLILGSFLLMGLTACQSDGQSAANDSTAQAEQAGKGSVVGPPMIPVQNALSAKLMTNYWVFEYYVVPGDRAASRDGQGRWYKFHPDGTFESGRWEDEVWGSGNWYLGVEDGKNVLKIDSNVDAEDVQWELQGQTEEAMSWSGTKTSNNGVILKAINLMTIPTKAQFGFQ